MFGSKLSKQFCSVLLMAMLIGVGSGAIAQNPSPTGGKKTKAKAVSCDGAADIVPAKPMNFVRKRRPTPKERAAEAKSDKNQ